MGHGALGGDPAKLLLARGIYRLLEGWILWLAGWAGVGERLSDRELFDGDGLGQVAGLVYVAAAADGYVIGQQLERDDFDEGA